ncbi:MAG TPA: FtsX-like permease family protein [Acidobacteriota bacterium]
MTAYFWRALRAHFGAGRILFLLSVAGVALGVAAVLCIQIINRSAVSAFSGAIQAISGGADLTILSRAAVLPESLYPRALATRGVAAAWPLYRVEAFVRGRRALYLDVLGVDFFAPSRLPLRAMRGDRAAALAAPGWVAITPELARREGWRIGDAIEVSSGTRRARLRIGALVDFRRLSPLASSKLAVMDIAQAQSLLGVAGEIHQIDVRAREGVELTALADRLQRRLGPAAQVLTPEQRAQRGAGLLGAFRLNLTALSLISLFVGLFLIYTSTQASLVRRRLEFGLLRSLGATSRQVLLLILGEVSLLGLVGVALGVPLGIWASAANLELVSRTISNIYLLDEIESLRLPPWLLLLAAAIGIGGALAGAFFPALDMSRRDAKRLLAPFALHETIGALAPRLFWAGLALLASAALWFWLFGRGWKPGGFVPAIALLVGLPLMTPLLIQQSCGRIRLRGFGLGYSLKSLELRLHTSSFAIAGLGVAVTMLIGISLMVGSFRRTVELWIGSTVRADLYVSAESWRRGAREATLDPGLVQALSADPAVRATDRLRQLFVYAGDQRISLSGIDIGAPIGAPRFQLLRGDARRALERVRRAGAALISEPLARKLGLAPGDALELAAPRGIAKLEVAGVYYDYSTESGAAVIDLRTMTELFGAHPINSLALYLQPGLDPDRVADRLRAEHAEAPLRIRSNRRLREDVLKVFDQTFAITHILQAMSLLIAVCGITLSLLVLAQQRISELALYRALGTRRGRIFGIFVGEGLGMGALGLLQGLAGGVALALILIFVINRAYFGWTIQLHWPGGAILGQGLTILAAAVLASLYPAARASRTPATELSRDL